MYAITTPPLFRSFVPTDNRQHGAQLSELTFVDCFPKLTILDVLPRPCRFPTLPAIPGGHTLAEGNRLDPLLGAPERKQFPNDVQIDVGEEGALNLSMARADECSRRW